jgi:hypothetical protein
MGEDEKDVEGAGKDERDAEGDVEKRLEATCGEEEKNGCAGHNEREVGRGAEKKLEETWEEEEEEERVRGGEEDEREVGRDAEESLEGRCRDGCARHTGGEVGGAGTGGTRGTSVRNLSVDCDTSLLRSSSEISTTTGFGYDASESAANL